MLNPTVVGVIEWEVMGKTALKWPLVRLGTAMGRATVCIQEKQAEGRSSVVQRGDNGWPMNVTCRVWHKGSCGELFWQK